MSGLINKIFTYFETKENNKIKEIIKDNEIIDSTITEYDFVLPFDMTYPITSGFGWRINPVTQQQLFHTGIDIAVPCNTLLLAMFSGEVIKSAYDDLNGYYVKLKSGKINGNIYIVSYVHLNAIYTKQNDMLGQGQIIGISGKTGRVTGCCLHITLRKNNELVDPMTIFNLWYK